MAGKAIIIADTDTGTIYARRYRGFSENTPLGWITEAQQRRHRREEAEEFTVEEARELAEKASAYLANARDPWVTNIRVIDAETGGAPIEPVEMIPVPSNNPMWGMF